jgi:hypothetical protein
MSFPELRSRQEMKVAVLKVNESERAQKKLLQLLPLFPCDPLKN